MTLLIGMPGGSESALIFIIVGLLLSLVVHIFYIITLQNTLKAISIQNRKMPPGNVWLLLIPLFGIIYHFIVVNNLADSIAAEAVSKNIKIAEPRPGYKVGLVMCILHCCFFIPVLNIFTGIACFVCWILFWAKISDYKDLMLDAHF